MMFLDRLLPRGMSSSPASFGVNGWQRSFQPSIKFSIEPGATLSPWVLI